MLEIEITKVNTIEGGIEVFARVWEDSTQIGFGKDGTVDIERFRIFNPPVLVEDPNGEIIRITPAHEPLGVPESISTYREDPEEALLQTLEHTIKQVVTFDDSNIVPNKVGNTITTIFAITAGDGYVGVGSGTWPAAHDNTTASDSSDSSTGLFLLTDDAGSTYRIYRMLFPFDTSVIGTGEVVSAATMSVWFISYSGSGHTSMTAELGLTTQASTTAVAAGDYDNWDELHQMTSAGQITLPSSGSTGQYFDFTMDATGQGWIDVTTTTGRTKLGVRYSKDSDETTGHSSAPIGNSHRNFASSDTTGTSNDPKLVVTHSSGAVAAENALAWCNF